MAGSGEKRLVQSILEGDADSLGNLRGRLQPGLRPILLARGASATQADDLLADLWSDCVPKADDGRSLLEKFHGRCPLQSWLATVVTHRLVDLRRRQAKCAGSVDDEQARDRLMVRPPTQSSSLPLTESALSNALRQALMEAFRECAAESLLMLRLVHSHGLTQREVGSMWGWHETKVSRTLKQAMESVREHTLGRLRRIDPWLHLEWDDLIEVCANTEGGLLPG